MTRLTSTARHDPSPPIVRIIKGTFFHQAESPRSSPPSLFSNLTFELPSTRDQSWCVVGPSLSGKTSLLRALQGRMFCQPPTARSYPYLSSGVLPPGLRNPETAIRYVGFDAESAGGGLAGSSVKTAAYLSARYESRREDTDFSLRDYLLGNTVLNPASSTATNQQQQQHADADGHFDRVVTNLNLSSLLSLPAAFLSNGQGRRARIARALLLKPEVLLLDEPFMGLDPLTAATLSPLLQSLVERGGPRVVLSSRPQDALPEWLTHLVYLTPDCQVGAMGPRDEVMRYVEETRLHKQQRSVFVWNEQHKHTAGQSSSPSLPEALVEMDGCVVRYGDKTVLGNWSQTAADGSKKDGLVWTVRRGERWGVFGANGSGKTTVVSLLCSDHPQAYALPLKLFGRGRLPDRQRGDDRPPMTLWDVQARIGHSSPEVHRHMPSSHSIRQVLESAWADTFRSRPSLSSEVRERVNAVLGWFEPELNPAARRKTADTLLSITTPQDLSWADEHMFGRLPFSTQRVALLLRAVIKQCDLVVLDEAFSGMDDSVRDKCMAFLDRGSDAVSPMSSTAGPRVSGLSDDQVLICISHVKDECPSCVREWMCLPEANTGLPARFGRLDGPLAADHGQWDKIWGVNG